METKEVQTNALVKIIQTSGLEQNKANYILEKFTSYFQIAAEWEEKAKMLEVKDESQTAEMKMAREGRLFLKNKRIDIEKARKELKEQSLREGQTIDNIARILKNLIEPIENYLEQQEKFIEIKQAEFKESRREERIKKLLPFQVEVSFYDLLNMFDAEFDQLYKGIEFSYNQRIKAEKKAEADRIAKEKAEAKERERIRFENEKLRKQAEERERLMKKQRAEAEAKQRETEAKAEAERKEQEEKLRKEREERERLEAELKAKKETELKARAEAKAEAEAELKAKAESERKARLAPDKTKILNLAKSFKSFELPQVKSPEAKDIIEKTRDYLNKLAVHIREKAENL